MARTRVKILKQDPDHDGVWKVRVPGIYGNKCNPLPKRMSRLVLPAAQALQKAYGMIASEGGHLYISDMFRSAMAQQRTHEDWKSGRKSAYSPPSCGSVHEAARAIDIDAFDTGIGIGHRRVREILNKCAWTHIVENLTGPERWHDEFRES
jgi:streptogramin lyase